MGGNTNVMPEIIFSNSSHHGAGESPVLINLMSSSFLKVEASWVFGGVWVVEWVIGTLLSCSFGFSMFESSVLCIK